MNQHPLACGLIQHVESHHHHVPAVVGHRFGQHRVRRVGVESFGDAQETNVALFPLADQLADELVAGCLVLAGKDAMEVVQVDRVATELAKALLDPLGHFRRRQHSLVIHVRARLGRDEDLLGPRLAKRLADDLLGSVRLGGVNVGYAQFERPGHDRHSVRRFQPGRVPQPASPAATEAELADRLARPAQRYVFHRISPACVRGYIRTRTWPIAKPEAAPNRTISWPDS